jgi:dipeptidase
MYPTRYVITQKSAVVSYFAAGACSNAYLHPYPAAASTITTTVDTSTDNATADSTAVTSTTITTT